MTIITNNVAPVINLIIIQTENHIKMDSTNLLSSLTRGDSY